MILSKQIEIIYDTYSWDICDMYMYSYIIQI